MWWLQALEFRIAAHCQLSRRVFCEIPLHLQKKIFPGPSHVPATRATVHWSPDPELDTCLPWVDVIPNSLSKAANGQMRTPLFEISVAPRWSHTAAACAATAGNAGRDLEAKSVNAKLPRIKKTLRTTQSMIQLYQVFNQSGCPL